MKLLPALKKYFALLRAHLPSTLPHQNKDEFEAWLTTLFALFNLPDSPNYRQAVAASVMQLPATQSKMPKAYFARVIRKSMANQIAYWVIEEVRALDKKLQQQEEEALKLAADKGEPARIEACEPK